VIVTVPRNEVPDPGNIWATVWDWCPNAATLNPACVTTCPVASMAVTVMGSEAELIFPTAIPVLIVAGDRKSVDAGVAWADTPCCGTPFTAKAHSYPPSEAGDATADAYCVPRPFCDEINCHVGFVN
jgi:hypothetical protein